MPENPATHQGQPQDSAFLNFQQLFDNLPTPYMVMDRDLVIIYGNTAYLRAVERDLDELAGRYVFDCFPENEERVDYFRNIFLKTLEGETTRFERESYQLLRPDGSSSARHWQSVHTPYYDPSGRVGYIIQQIDDITELVELETQNESITRKLDHRAKNIFAVVQSIAALSSQNATSVEAFRQDFTGRIAAMARTYEALAQSQEDGLTLGEILIGELEEYGDVPSPRISVSGPDYYFSRQTSQDISMVVHELAKNAAKFGCLSTKDGKLSVSWTVDPETAVIDLVWDESGLSGITAPTKLGFGTRLADFMRNIKVDRTYRDEGLLLKARLTPPEA